MANPIELTQGSIVWISAPDPQGRNPKLRAFVIVTPTPQIKAESTVVGVAVTSTYRDLKDEPLIPMRWNAAGTTETGFNMKCFAKCDWLRKIPVKASEAGGFQVEGQFEGKRVRTVELVKILDCVNKVRARGDLT